MVYPNVDPCEFDGGTADRIFVVYEPMVSVPAIIQIDSSSSLSVFVYPCAFDATAVVVEIIYPNVPKCEFDSATAERVWTIEEKMNTIPAIIQIDTTSTMTAETDPCSFDPGIFDAVIVPSQPNITDCDFGDESSAVIIATPDLCIVASGIAREYVGGMRRNLIASTATFFVYTQSYILKVEKDRMASEMVSVSTVTATGELKPPSMYGFEYNGYAVLDSRNIANSGWHIPTETDWNELESHLGATVAANRLKQQGNATWNIPNQVDAIDDVGFTSLGAGERTLSGVYQNRRIHNPYWTATLFKGNLYSKTLACDSASIQHGTDKKEAGRSLRVVRDSLVGYIDGSKYIGNDLKEYATVQIGNQVWITEDLAETKFRNGNVINLVGDKKTWMKLTTSARCPYNNDMTPIKT